jgi:hypothetical protein
VVRATCAAHAGGPARPGSDLPLRTLVTESKDDQLALEALWSLHVSGGLTEAFAEPVLRHRSPHVPPGACACSVTSACTTSTVSRLLHSLGRDGPDVRALNSPARQNASAQRGDGDRGTPVAPRRG